MTPRTLRSEETPSLTQVPPLPQTLKHIAIIMDGNGRWAQNRHLPRIMGHRRGVEVVREIIKASIEIGLPYLTLYAFSQENWKRPAGEVSLLMEILEQFLDSESAELKRQQIRFRTIGHTEELPANIHAKLNELIQATQSYNRLHLTVALNYGARREILDAAMRMAAECSPEQMKQMNEEGFGAFLSTAGIPDPDMLIRTSGEMRLSNFLLWQLSYSEIYITEKYWPDFGRPDLLEAVSAFQKRDRRFGAVR